MKSTKLLTLIAFATILVFAGCKEDTFEEIIGECPIVLVTNPEDEAIDVPRDQIITVAFNKQMNPSTITNESITLQSPAEQVSGVGTYSGETATFLPSAILMKNTKFTNTVIIDIISKK
jgi:hypothetical protein